MTGLYIASTQPRAGKTMCACSLGVLLQKRGCKVGYIKPLGDEAKTVEAGRGDAGALIVQELLGQDAAPEKLTPIIRPRDWSGLGMLLTAEEDGNGSSGLEEIKKAYAEIARDKDLVLVNGSGIFPASGQFAGVDGLTLAKNLDLRVLLVESCEEGFDFDSVLFIKNLLGGRLRGVILNKIAPKDLHLCKKIFAPYLEKRGVKTLGMIPYKPELNAIRCMNLSYELNGRIVAGNSSAAMMGVTNFVIGSMQVETFMMHMRTRSSCAVVMGGDRTDLQLAALQNKSNCLVLTGNLAPGELVRAKAEKLEVPVIVVKEDTYTVARRIAQILKDRKFSDLLQIDLGLKLVEESVELDALSSLLDPA